MRPARTRPRSLLMTSSNSDVSDKSLSPASRPQSERRIGTTDLQSVACRCVGATDCKSVVPEFLAHCGCAAGKEVFSDALILKALKRESLQAN